MWNISKDVLTLNTGARHSWGSRLGVKVPTLIFSNSKLNYTRQTSSVTSLIQNLGWTDLKTRRTNSRPSYMFKILNELVEIPINDRCV